MLSHVATVNQPACQLSVRLSTCLWLNYQQLPFPPTPWPSLASAHCSHSHPLWHIIFCRCSPRWLKLICIYFSLPRDHSHALTYFKNVKKIRPCNSWIIINILKLYKNNCLHQNNCEPNACILTGTITCLHQTSCEHNTYILTGIIICFRQSNCEHNACILTRTITCLHQTTCEHNACILTRIIVCLHQSNCEHNACILTRIIICLHQSNCEHNACILTGNILCGQGHNNQLNFRIIRQATKYLPILTFWYIYIYIYNIVIVPIKWTPVKWFLYTVTSYIFRPLTWPSSGT